MSEMSITTQTPQQTATQQAYAEIAEIRNTIKDLKVQKAEKSANIETQQAYLDAHYNKINNAKDNISHIKFEIGNAKANLSCIKEKAVTLIQAKRENDAKAQFGSLITQYTGEIDSLYDQLDDAKVELQTLYNEIPPLKANVRFAYVEFNDIKHRISELYAEIEKLRPPKPIEEDKPKQETQYRPPSGGKYHNKRKGDNDDETPRRRGHGKPPGGSYKCRKGH